MPSCFGTARATSARSPVSMTVLPHACRVKARDGLGGVVLHYVGDDDVAGVASVNRHVQDRAGQLAVLAIHAVRAHELVVAHQHHMLVDTAATPWPASLATSCDAFLVDRAGVCLA